MLQNRPQLAHKVVGYASMAQPWGNIDFQRGDEGEVKVLLLLTLLESELGDGRADRRVSTQKKLPKRECNTNRRGYPLDTRPG